MTRIDAAQPPTRPLARCLDPVYPGKRSRLRANVSTRDGFVLAASGRVSGRSLPARQRGFTLLEVIVALTITALALGGLFGVIAGNKQLAWRAEAALLRAAEVRSMINLTQLDDSRGDLELSSASGTLQADAELELEPPSRRTVGSRFTLRAYEIVDERGEVRARGTHLVELALPE